MVKFREVRLTDAISFLTLMCSFVLMVEISLANVSNFNQNFNYQNEVYIKVYENHNPIPKYINQQETIKCFKREYVFQAVQIDTFGRKCWDYIKVMTCWGRCDSGEVRSSMALDSKVFFNFFFLISFQSSLAFKTLLIIFFIFSIHDIYNR